MRSILERFCNIQMIEYNSRHTPLFTYDGNSHIGLLADELEGTVPEYKGVLVLGDRNDKDVNDNINTQSLTIKFEFLLLNSTALSLEINLCILFVQMLCFLTLLNDITRGKYLCL